MKNIIKFLIVFAIAVLSCVGIDTYGQSINFEVIESVEVLDSASSVKSTPCMTQKQVVDYMEGQLPHAVTFEYWDGVNAVVSSSKATYLVYIDCCCDIFCFPCFLGWEDLY